MKILARALMILGVAALAAPACADRVAGPSGPTVSVAVAPLDLPSMTDACYSLTVWNHADPDHADAAEVWTQPILCASQYGANGGIRFTGICDASDGGANSIRLVLNDVYSGGTGGIPNGVALAAGDDYVNPCPAPEAGTEDNGCVLPAQCVENQDTLVEFNLTVMRQAELGFFDTVVRFSDVFCAAKLDCVNQSGDTLHYLHNPATGSDGPTAVLGFTCLSSSGAPVEMILDDLVITCVDGQASTQTATVNPAGGLGNLDGASIDDAQGILFGAAVHAGPAFGGARYWNVLLGMNLDTTSNQICTLTTHGTASEHGFAFDEGTNAYVLPAGSRYPYITWDVVLSDDAERVCARHPLNGTDAQAGVGTAYSEIATPVTFAHRLDLPVTCPCWEVATLSGLIKTNLEGALGSYATGANSAPTSTGGGSTLLDPVTGEPIAGTAHEAGVSEHDFTDQGLGAICGYMGPDSGGVIEVTAVTTAEYEQCAADISGILGFDGPCPCWDEDFVNGLIDQIVELGDASELGATYHFEDVGGEIGGEVSLWSGTGVGDYRLRFGLASDSDGAECGLSVSPHDGTGWGNVFISRAAVLSPEDVTTCVSVFDALADNRCLVGNGDCGGDTCVYVSPGENDCVVD